MPREWTTALKILTEQHGETDLVTLEVRLAEERALSLGLDAELLVFNMEERGLLRYDPAREIVSLPEYTRR